MPFWKKWAWARNNLKEKGLKNVRLRLHGDVIRIEVERSAMKTVLEMAEDVVSYIKGWDFAM